MEPIGYPETSVTNYQSKLRNIPEDWRAQHNNTCIEIIFCWQKIVKRSEERLLSYVIWRYLVCWVVVDISEERTHKTAWRHIPESGSHNTVKPA